MFHADDHCHSEPVLTTCWVACSLHRTMSRLETMAALRSSSSSTTPSSSRRCRARRTMPMAPSTIRCRAPPRRQGGGRRCGLGPGRLRCPCPPVSPPPPGRQGAVAVFGTEDQPGGVMRRPGQPHPGGPCDASAWPAADLVFVWDGGGMGSVIVPLPVDDLAVLRQRRSAKWRTYPKDVLPLTIAEMDFPIAEPVAEALRAAGSRSDTGYAMPGPEFGDAVAKFGTARWGWPGGPGSVTAVPDTSA